MTAVSNKNLRLTFHLFWDPLAKILVQRHYHSPFEWVNSIQSENIYLVSDLIQYN